MATFYTRPDITTRGMREPESISEMLTRFAQLQAFSDDRRYRRLREQEMSLRLEELRRAERDALAMRGAYAAGVKQTTALPEKLPIYGGTMSGPSPLGGAAGPVQGPSIPPQTDVSFNRQAALQALAQSSPEQVPGMQQQFASQDEAHQKAMIDLADKVATVDEKELKNMMTRVDKMGSLAQSVILNPNSYSSAKALAEKMGFIQPGRLPEQFTPEMIPILQTWANQAMQVKDVIQAEETKRHNQAMEKRDTSITPFEVWRQQHPNAPVGEWLALQHRYREGGGETPAQRLARQRAFNLAETQKNSALSRAEREIRTRYGLTGFAATEAWPQQAVDELQGEKQRIQDEYETKLSTLGADVEHFGYGEPRTARQPSRVPSGRSVRLDSNNAEHRRIAQQILAEAGGDKEKARQIARQRGYMF